MEAGALAAARGVIGVAPERARTDVALSLFHAWNALYATIRPAQLRRAQLAVTASAAAVPAWERASAIVYPTPNDTIWTCGAYLDGVPLRQLAEAKLTTSFRLASMCVDVNGDLVQQRDGRDSCPAVGSPVDQIDASDLIFCVASRMQADLHRVAAESGRPEPRVRLARLGADLQPGPTGHDHTPSERVSRLADGRFALAVGTVEPTRNYGLLLRVWERLSSEPDFDLDLAIVGREGDGADDMKRWIRMSPLRNRVHWLEQVTDEDLQILYSACRLFVCPRLDDRWVLPVSEALTTGAPVLCSDRPLLRQASYGRAILLDPLDVDAWVTAIRAARVAARHSREQAALPTWDECAALVKAALVDPLPK